MKKILFTVLLVGAALAGNAQRKYPTPKQSKQDKDVWDVTNNKYTELSYQTYNELLAESEKESKLAMLTPEDAEKKKALIPKGGYLMLYVTRSNINVANLSNFTAVIQNEAGAEIFREEFKANVPDLGAGANFVNLGLLRMNEPLPQNAKVFIVDALEQKRYEYLVKQ